jgi:hypothetical protein
MEVINEQHNHFARKNDVGPPKLGPQNLFQENLQWWNTMDTVAGQV